MQVGYIGFFLPTLNSLRRKLIMQNVMEDNDYPFAKIAKRRRKQQEKIILPTYRTPIKDGNGDVHFDHIITSTVPYKQLHELNEDHARAALDIAYNGINKEVKSAYPSVVAPHREADRYWLDFLHDKMATAFDSEKLHPRDLQIMRQYTSKLGSTNHDLINSYFGINSKKKTPQDMLTPYEMDTVQSVIKNHRLPMDIHVHSGIGFDPAHIGIQHNNFHIVHLPAFTSTSIDPVVGFRFAKAAEHVDENSQKATGKPRSQHFFSQGSDHTIRHMVSVHVPKGSHTFYMEPFSAYPDEHEVLFSPGAKIAVHKTPVIMREHFHNQGTGEKIEYQTHIFHGVLLHDGIAPTRHATE